MEAVKNTGMWMRRCVLILGLVVATLFTLLLAPQKAEAHGTTYPHHVGRYASCDNYYNKITSNYPSYIRSWYNRYEEVYWTPDLYKWNGSRWVKYRTWPYWYKAVASPTGLTWGGFNQWNGTWAYMNNVAVGPYSSPHFDNLSPGYYAVGQIYEWSSHPDYQHFEYQTFSNGSQQCRIT